MTSESPLILQIQHDCLDQNVGITDILRKAKVAATKLDLSTFLEWINHELDGYKGTIDDLLTYRVTSGEPKAHNPFYGWQAMIIPNPDMAKVLSTVPISEPIGAIDDLLRRSSKGDQFIFPYSSDIKAKIIRRLEHPTDIHIEISRGSLVAIVKAVRNIVLDWTLELERSGVIGDGLIFGQKDKIQAIQVTNDFVGSNVGFVGHAQDNTTISNVQSMYNRAVDIERLLGFVHQMKDEMHRLPDPIREEAATYLHQLDEELSINSPNHSKLISLLVSIRTVCEGAIGNVSAEGMMSLITRLLNG